MAQVVLSAVEKSFGETIVLKPTDLAVADGEFVVLVGPSGSGKSILAATFLAEGARRGETGVIAAFEQHPNRSRNLVVADLIKAGVVGLVDSHSPGLSIDEIVTLLMVEIRRLKASRVVIDSLSGFEVRLAPTFRDDFRESLSRLVATLAASGVTVHRPALQPVWHRLFDRRHHRAALHRG